jgi:hypothetical protein
MLAIVTAIVLGAASLLRPNHPINLLQPLKLFGMTFKVILEEILFRFLLIAYLLKYFSWQKTLLLSALVFAFVHFAFSAQTVNFPQLYSYFVGGLLYGGLYLFTGNPFIPTLTHLVWNIYGVIWLSDTLIDSGYFGLVVTTKLLVFAFTLLYFRGKSIKVNRNFPI